MLREDEKMTIQKKNQKLKVKTVESCLGPITKAWTEYAKTVVSAHERYEKMCQSAWKKYLKKIKEMETKE